MRPGDPRRTILSLAMVVVALLALHPPDLLKMRFTTAHPTPSFVAGGRDSILPATASGGIARWSDGVVRYFNAAPDQEWALSQAVDAWNGSGAGVRFVAVPRDQAGLVIEHDGGSSCGTANATLGFAPGARVHVFVRDDASGSGCDSYTAAVALAHELGHVLGLEHDDAHCSAMNPSSNYRGHDRCVPLPAWSWYCRLLEPIDVARATAIYGGTPAPRGEAGCPLYDAISPPTNVRLDRSADSARGLTVAFSQPGEPRVPGFLAQRSGIPSFSATLSRDTCPEKPSNGRYRWSSGIEELSYPQQAPGDYCFAVWAFDAFGRPSDRPATLRIDVLG